MESHKCKKTSIDVGENKFLNKIKSFDKFGQSLKIQNYGNSSHKTVLGGITTIIVYPLLAVMAITMLFFFDINSKTVIYTAQEMSTRDDPSEGIMLVIDGKIKLGLKVMVMDETYDNDDNPYGRLIFH